MCDFIYFSSLAHLWKAGEARRVLFLHVPSDSSDKSVSTGLELGYFRYLVKPYDLVDLTDAVDAAIDAAKGAAPG